MKKIFKKSNGFTLAELLIVVAIIAVLVAISIPIFTTQLEKAREATDLSDVRSAYAEVMMAAISEDTTATYSKDPSQTIYKSNGIYSVTVSPLHQEQDNWQSSTDLSIGGVSSTDSTHWIGTPTAKGSCEVSYNPTGDSLKLNWSGKSSGNGNAGSGTNSGSGGSSGSGNTPAPNPGTGGGSGNTGGSDNTGGNASGGSGNTGDSGNAGGNTSGGNTSGGSGNNQGSGDSKPDTDTKDPDVQEDSFEALKDLAETFPTTDQYCLRGNLYVYNNKLYLCKVPGTYNGTWNNPEGSLTWQFPEITEEAVENCLTYSDWKKWPDGSLYFDTVTHGTIYRDQNNNYFFYYGNTNGYSIVSPPNNNVYATTNDPGTNWVPILPETHKRS